MRRREMNGAGMYLVQGIEVGVGWRRTLVLELGFGHFLGIETDC